MPAVVNGKCQEHCKRRQQARRRRLVVDEKAQQHRPLSLITVTALKEFKFPQGRLKNAEHQFLDRFYFIAWPNAIVFMLTIGFWTGLLSPLKQAIASNSPSNLVKISSKNSFRHFAFWKLLFPNRDFTSPETRGQWRDATSLSIQNTIFSMMAYIRKLISKRFLPNGGRHWPMSSQWSQIGHSLHHATDVPRRPCCQMCMDSCSLWLVWKSSLVRLK